MEEIGFMQLLKQLTKQSQDKTLLAAKVISTRRQGLRVSNVLVLRKIIEDVRETTWFCVNSAAQLPKWTHMRASSLLGHFSLCSSHSVNICAECIRLHKRAEVD